jgi:hypothetical protein
LASGSAAARAPAGASAPGALACFDLALEQARARPADGGPAEGDEAMLLAHRAELLRGLGRIKEARADLAAGRKASASPGGASVRAARALDAVGRWLDLGPR